MLNAKRLKFIDKYVHQQDVKMAAKLSGYEPEYGFQLYSNPEIRAEIDRRLLIQHTEEAKLVVKEKILNRDLLDRELIKVVESDVSPTKLNAIEMGYKRIGMINNGEFIPDPDQAAQPKPGEAPRIFRVTQTSILAHKIETTRTDTVSVTQQRAPFAPNPPDSQYEF